MTEGLARSVARCGLLSPALAVLVTGWRTSLSGQMKVKIKHAGLLFDYLLFDYLKVVI